MQIHLRACALATLGLLYGCAADADTAPPAGHSTAADSTNKQRIETVSPSRAAELLASNDVVVLDIRTPREFARGHLVGAVNINYSGENRDEQLRLLDKSKTYVMH